jgi:hypothetical protein
MAPKCFLTLLPTIFDLKHTYGTLVRPWLGPLLPVGTTVTVSTNLRDYVVKGYEAMFDPKDPSRDEVYMVIEFTAQSIERVSLLTDVALEELQSIMEPNGRWRPIDIK